MVAENSCPVEKKAGQKRSNAPPAIAIATSTGKKLTANRSPVLLIAVITITATIPRMPELEFLNLTLYRCPPLHIYKNSHWYYPPALPVPCRYLTHR